MSATRVRPELQALITVGADEMAEILGAHPKTVLRWAREGRIPCIRIGGRVVRFRPAEVLAALQQAGAEGRESA